MKLDERDLKSIKRVIDKLINIQLTNKASIENEDSLHFLRIAYSSIQAKMIYDKTKENCRLKGEIK